MNKEPTFKELLKLINKGAEYGKPNCSIGLFISEYHDDKVKEHDNFVVKKPVVNISTFLEDNELYYNVEFCFKSYEDVDYKQMWKYLCKYTDLMKRERESLEAGKELDKLLVLSVSILPEIYKGKYSIYINMPLLETISCSINAFDKSAVISFVCTEEGFGALKSDDDIIDRHSIEREAEQEILAEMEAEEKRT